MTRDDDVEQLVALTIAAATVLRELETDLRVAALPDKARLARSMRIALSSAAERVRAGRPSSVLRRTGEWKPPTIK